MGNFLRLLVLSLMMVPVAQAQSLLPGDKVPDFSLPSANGGWGQRLSEQKGQPLMVIWTDRCNRCEEELARYQLLAESHALDGLVSWIVWTPYKSDRPPLMRLPVLENNEKWRTGWDFNPKPAVMLIDADGTLRHLFTGNLQRQYDQVENLMAGWVSTQKRAEQTP